jgi:hypothetical protein
LYRDTSLKVSGGKAPPEVSQYSVPNQYLNY